MTMTVTEEQVHFLLLTMPLDELIKDQLSPQILAVWRHLRHLNAEAEDRFVALLPRLFALPQDKQASWRRALAAVDLLREHELVRARKHGLIAEKLYVRVRTRSDLKALSKCRMQHPVTPGFHRTAAAARLPPNSPQGDLVSSYVGYFLAGSGEYSHEETALWALLDRWLVTK